MLACAALLALAVQPSFERVVEPNQTAYSVVVGDCRISLEVYHSDLNRHVLRYRAACPLDFAKQAPLIAALVRHVVEAEGGPARFTTLFWGRLHPDGTQDSTLAARLARAAQSSAGWNPATGQPRRGGANAFVRDLANQAMIYQELRDALCGAGFDVRVTAVEKVLVLPARRLPFLETRSSARLPFDSMTWFSLAPAAGCRLP